MNHFKRHRLFAGLLLVCGADAWPPRRSSRRSSPSSTTTSSPCPNSRRNTTTRAAQARAQLQGEELDKTLDQIKTELLNPMITDLLLLQMAKEKNFNVSEQVKMALDNIKKENNIDTDEELKRAVRSQGMDYEIWLKQIEETMMRQGVVYSEVNKALAARRGRGRRVLQDPQSRVHRAGGIQGPGRLPDAGRPHPGRAGRPQGRDRRQGQGRHRFRPGGRDLLRCAHEGNQGRPGHLSPARSTRPWKPR